MSALRVNGKFVGKAAFQAAADRQTTTGGPDAWDNRSHIDRINGEGNPAAIPGQEIVRQAGGRPLVPAASPAKRRR